MPAPAPMHAPGPGRIERWRSDRKIRTWVYAAISLNWLSFLLLPGDSGRADGAWWAAAACVGFALCAVLEWRAWRRDGRQVRPVSTLPPDLTGEQTARVRELVRADETIAAVRFVREETGAGLLAAKRAVDAAAGT